MSTVLLVGLIGLLLFLFVRRRRGTEKRSSVLDVVVLALLATYAAAAIVWLLAGLAPALARAFPSLQSLFDAWGRGEGGFAAVAKRVAIASRGCHEGMQVTELRLVPIGEITANYLFSAIDIVLAALLLRLRPRDWTARLLVIGLVGTGAVFNAQAHCAPDVLPQPIGSGFEWIHDNVFHLVSGVAYIYALLLFPDGRLVPRWRAPWLRRPARAIYAAVVGALGLAVVSFFHGTDPSGFVAFFGVVVPIAGVTSQALRYRHATTLEERQQSRILLWALAMAFVGAVLFGVIAWGTDALTGGSPFVGGFRRIVFLVFPLLFAVIPVTLFVVLVRYRLWEIDKVINKALVYAALAALLTVVYLAIVVGVGVVMNTRGQPNVGLSILATIAVAVAFQPLRERLQRLANRLVYGNRATPYEVLSDFSERMAGAFPAEEVLPGMARMLGEGTGARTAEVWLRVGHELRPGAVWPNGDAAGSVGSLGPLPLRKGELPEIAGRSGVAAVRHRGELLGALAVRKPPSDPVTPTEQKLLNDLASQAGLVLHNVRLTGELRGRLEEISRQAEELQASRKRLVAAQDEERRRLERNIHDGAQQQLVALTVKLRLARMLAGKDPHKAEEMLTEVEQEATDALENLRDLARGIYPPLLADKGLVAALEAQARKAPVPTAVASDGISRYPQEVEAAVYFCCLEALQNMTKYAGATRATITLRDEGGELSFSVQDDGTGFDPATTHKGSGLQNMADRLSAIGGELEVVSRPGEGTTVIGRVPLRELEPVG